MWAEIWLIKYKHYSVIFLQGAFGRSIVRQVAKSKKVRLSRWWNHPLWTRLERNWWGAYLECYLAPLPGGVHRGEGDNAGVYSDSRNLTKAFLSDAKSFKTYSLDPFASPPCQSTASSKVLARPSYNISRQKNYPPMLEEKNLTKCSSVRNLWNKLWTEGDLCSVSICILWVLVEHNYEMWSDEPFVLSFVSSGYSKEITEQFFFNESIPKIILHLFVGAPPCHIIKLSSSWRE